MNTELKNDAAQDVQKPLSPRNKRMRLFLATYSLGPIVVFLSGAGFNIFHYLITFPNPLVIIGGFMFLPMGVMSFLDYASTMPMTERHPLVRLLIEQLPWLGVLSYLLFFLLAVFGSSTEKPRTFRLLYLLFVTLVIVNVAGCLSNSLIIY